MKTLLLLMIHGYRFTSPIRNLLYTSIGVSGGCRQYPTCSKYAVNILTDKQYDTIQSVQLILSRLGQCHSFSRPKFKQFNSQES